MNRSCKMIVTPTPDGVVCRRVWAGGEDAYRRSASGDWSHSIGHKGPWIETNVAIVPADVLHEIVQHIEEPQP